MCGGSTLEHGCYLHCKRDVDRRLLAALCACLVCKSSWDVQGRAWSGQHERQLRLVRFQSWRLSAVLLRPEIATCAPGVGCTCHRATSVIQARQELRRLVPHKPLFGPAQLNYVDVVVVIMHLQSLRARHGRRRKFNTDLSARSEIGVGSAPVPLGGSSTGCMPRAAPERSSMHGSLWQPPGTCSKSDASQSYTAVTQTPADGPAGAVPQIYGTKGHAVALAIRAFDSFRRYNTAAWGVMLLLPGVD